MHNLCFTVVPLIILSIIYFLVLFLFEKKFVKISHASFCALASLICSNISSSIVILMENIALLALTFHFLKVIASNGFSTSLPPTICQRSWPYNYDSCMHVAVLLSFLLPPTTWSSLIVVARRIYSTRLNY